MNLRQKLIEKTKFLKQGYSIEKLNNLVYFTVGFNPEYIDMLYLAVKSLRIWDSVDVIVICDESFIPRCAEALKEFSNISIVSCPDSTSAQDSSMKKLLIFNYDLEKYAKILFIDSDVLIGRNLDYFFNSIFQSKLYAGAESHSPDIHTKINHSLKNYTVEQLHILEYNKIYAFNCGFFGFLNNAEMKEHFNNILQMIKDWKGEYYYEQSFMNVYFNLRNLSDTTAIDEKTYKFRFYAEQIIENSKTIPFHKNKVVHFAWTAGAENKLFYMRKYWNLFVE
jgi:lipopolysaccharide biosynthesis glycosyltransferase